MLAGCMGDTIEVPTIDGSYARVSIPAGIQSGHQLRLKGVGMTILLSEGRGDMLVEVFVETPVKLTGRQQELLRQALRGD